MKASEANKGRSAPVVSIGPSKEAIAEARAAIMAILSADVDESTKVCALNALHTICSVNNTSMSNCTISS